MLLQIPKFRSIASPRPFEKTFEQTKVNAQAYTSSPDHEPRSKTSQLATSVIKSCKQQTGTTVSYEDQVQDAGKRPSNG
ncbi:hypothetical protein DVH05_005334 [Phytophthora capsici]|nr:hypothetical protein DVH05_005334 [Phytophthora capsici]